MEWFRYSMEWNGRSHQVIRPMGAVQAAQLGAELVPGFDPAQRVAGVLVCSFAPDGLLEASYPIEAEAPVGRL